MFNYSRSLDFRHHYSMGHKSYDDIFDDEEKNELDKTFFLRCRLQFLKQADQCLKTLQLQFKQSKVCNINTGSSGVFSNIPGRCLC